MSFGLTFADETAEGIDIRTQPNDCASTGACESFLDRGEALVLAGDFNVTAREVAYDDLSTRLQDVQLSTSSFPRPTWRGPWRRFIPFPFLRLDYIFCSATVTPLHTRVDAHLRGSDHCAVWATVVLRR